MFRPHGAHFDHGRIWRLVEVDITRCHWVGGAGHVGEFGVNDTVMTGNMMIEFFHFDRDDDEGCIFRN